MTYTHKYIRASAWLAVGFSIVLTIVETVHNWGDWSNPALWIIDYFACALLFAGGWLVLRVKSPAGLSLLTAGWGFACAMFWMAYFIIAADLSTSPRDADPIVEYFALGLFIWTLIGFGLALLGLAYQTHHKASSEM